MEKFRYREIDERWKQRRKNECFMSQSKCAVIQYKFCSIEKNTTVVADSTSDFIIFIYGDESYWEWKSLKIAVLITYWLKNETLRSPLKVSKLIFLQRVKRVAMFDKGQSTSIRESQIRNFFPSKIKAKVIRKCLANREMRMPHDWFTTSNFNLLK